MSPLKSDCALLESTSTAPQVSCPVLEVTTPIPTLGGQGGGVPAGGKFAKSANGSGYASHRTRY
jgi:hypothetical protein